MLRKSPTRTEAFLAANRRNALKSTGPRTERGKARSCMNALKHGRYARRLPEKLAEAGDQGGAALYQKVRGEIATAFHARPDSPRDEKQLERFTTDVWLLACSAGVNGRKPRSPYFSKKWQPAAPVRLRNRIENLRSGIGIVFWVQRRRYWTVEKKMQVLLGVWPVDVPTVGEALQDSLRHRVFPLRRLGLWERQRLGIGEYRNGVVAPDGQIRNRPQVTANNNGAQPDDAPRHGGEAGNSTTTAQGARAILARFLARLLGGN